MLCRWQEALCFQSIAHVGAVLMVEVVQEERVRHLSICRAVRILFRVTPTNVAYVQLPLSWPSSLSSMWTKIGRDVSVGALQLPLLQLQNQRVLEKWYPLSKDSQATGGELLLSCRLSRSRVRASSLRCAILQCTTRLTDVYHTMRCL